jgi:glycosyltransferase involved in cell wall biosynthesis
MPCLNEAETVAACVEKARAALETLGLRGEVIVADNGSTDGSGELASNAGAIVVHEEKRGYGFAYQAGFAAARGKYLVMADADDTYSFADLGKFVDALDRGYEFVIGNRFAGKMHPSAMPWLHRYIGNPLLSWILNRLFGTQVGDAHCGMRAMTADAYDRMGLRTGGMEFASEMIVRAGRLGLRMTEVPVDYHPRRGQSKLRTFRDGWRHLRFMLLLSPTYLFLVPGVFLALLGMLIVVLLLPGPLYFFGRFFDVHLMLFGAMAAIVGAQVAWLGLFARTYALVEKFESRDPMLETLYGVFTLEKGLALGFVLLLIGAGVGLYVVLKWIASGFGSLDESRVLIFALTLIALGVQAIFSSFLVSLLGLKRAR